MLHSLYSTDKVEMFHMESDSILTKKLFDFKTVKIFKDSYVLETDYIPDSLVGRDEEIKAVAEIFFPLFRHGKPGHAFIYGPPGSGKTVVIKHVLRQLYSEAGENINLKHLAVPCKKHNTTTKILSFLLHEIGYPETLPRSGVSCGYYYDIFFSYMKKQSHSLTIIFDEIDFLKDDNVLYNFSRSGEFKELNERQFIHIIGVSNTGEFVNSLDPRVDSSMQRETIVFPPYNKEQLIDILNMRIPLAFYSDVVCKGTVELCADESARDEGDARRAIFLLQAAGNFAIKTECTTVQPGHVMMASQKIKEDISLQFVLNMTFHEKFALLAMVNTEKYLKKGKFIVTGDVYRIYHAMCKFANEESLSLAAISQKITKFKMMGIINANVSSRGRGGLTSEIVFIGDPDILANAIYRDGTFVKFMTYTPDIKRICFVQVW